MIPVQCPYPPGLVAVISGDLARFTRFAICLQNLIVPAGTCWNWMMGADVASNRNGVLFDAFRDDVVKEIKWIWFIDDDHTFDRDVLMRLLKHDADIVQALASTRKPPYRPYAYQFVNGEYVTDRWEDLPPTGLHRCDAVGTGGMLIRRKVLDTVEYPWFEQGQTAIDTLGEDLHFCTKARRAGFNKIFVDTDARTGHCNTHEVWPQPVDGGWSVELDLLHNCRARLPRDFGEHVAEEMTYG